MKCKAFDVGIELEIQAVTCPGVWLCPNGQITVQIYLLGLCSQTSTMNPIFPLLCHEKFTFHKNFSNLSNLFELDHKLRKELVYMELIQWEDCNHGNVLATFKTSLSEMLYPFPKRRGMLAGVDVDLLMEATRKFPGIIAPKLEISTKMTIKEVLCSVKKEKQNDVYVVNPKLISSKCIPKRKVPLHQKKVCHSHRYHNSKQKKVNNKNNMMDFKNNLLGFDHYNHSSPKTSKKLKGVQITNGFYEDEDDNLDKEFVDKQIQQIRKSSTDMQCRCEETKVRCPLCEKYKCVFSEPCCCKNEKPHPSSSRICEFARELYVKRNSQRKSQESPEQNSPRSELHTHYHHSTDLNKNSRDSEKRNSKGNSRGKSLESSQQNSDRSELHTHNHNSTDLNRNIRDRHEKAHRSPVRFSFDNLCDAESCTDKFYKNLEQFYKQLYMRAHYKLKNERCKCKK